jgi:hypothetical protein
MDETTRPTSTKETTHQENQLQKTLVTACLQAPSITALANFSSPSA